MDISHFVVGGFTAIAIAFLVWAEIRSRRNTAAQEESPSVSLPQLIERSTQTKRGRRR